MSELKKSDPKIYEIVQAETRRQEEGLEMIASENYVSEAVLEAQGSVLTNKYAEGYPGKRYYGGCEFHDQIEDLARNRAKKLFGCRFANVQPHCGANANTAAFMAICDPGDTILSLPIKSGGHLSHGLKPNFSGTFYSIVDYDLDPTTELLDYDQIDALAARRQQRCCRSLEGVAPRNLRLSVVVGNWLISLGVRLAFFC